MFLNNVICIKVKHCTCAIMLDNILYMEKSRRQIIVHVIEGENVCFYGKYDSVLPMLDERFTHPHQSYVINMQHIIRLGRNEAVLLGGDKIEMGTRCFGRLKREYDQYIRKNIKSSMINR